MCRRGRRKGGCSHFSIDYCPQHDTRARLVGDVLPPRPGQKELFSDE